MSNLTRDDADTRKVDNTIEAPNVDAVSDLHHSLETFPVVGIGASAGGLEALEQFFSVVPATTPAAFIVVQHLSPDFPSMMASLLQRVTDVPVAVMRDKERIRPGCVYLLPESYEVIVSEGCLLLTERPHARELSFPIDQFLRSLADDVATRAIAVILSGTGTDGARGVAHIHEKGGLILAQEATSAKFDGMPRAASDTGLVDYIAAADEIPIAIENFCRQPSGPFPEPILTDQSPALDGPIYTALHLLKQVSGIDFGDYKTTTIGRRIQRRAMLSRSPDLKSYVDQLKNDPSEVTRLYQDLLIGVTSFFRDADVFSQLEKDIIPRLMDRLGEDDEFRVWVAGVATGEEAYSIAMLIDEYLRRNNQTRPVRIFATDVHEQSLASASRAVYDEAAVSTLSDARRERYFSHKADGYHASAELRKMVVCVSHNMIRDAPFTRIDLITCRNALIYLTPAAQHKTIALFHFALKRDGILFLGPSETLGDLADEFAIEDERAKLFRKSRDAPLPSTTRMAMRVSQSTPIPIRPPATPRPQREQAASLIKAYDLVLGTVMRAGMLVGSDRSLIHVFAEGSRFLRQLSGRFSQDVVEIIHEDLRPTLAIALRRQAAEAEPVVYESIDCTINDEQLAVRVTVQRLPGDETNDGYFLIQIDDATTSVPTAPVAVRRAANAEVYEIEKELESTRETLQSTIEQFQTTNEELQSTNEQLIASNEELQSTNEELHSVNEELYTVNSEHQRKIDELTELTADMDNLLATTNVHTIFLDRELRIRRFTPGIAAAFNLIPQDVGRRIDSFTYNLQDTELLPDIEDVLRSEEPKENEVRDRYNNWYLMRILPYRSHNRIDGVVVTLIDITRIKVAERGFAEVSEIVEHSDDAIMRLSPEGEIITWNLGAEKLFGYTREDVLRKNVRLLIPETSRHESETIFAHAIEGASVDRFETKRQCQDGRIIDVSLTLSPIRNEEGIVVGASEICRDVTARKAAEQEVRNGVRDRDRFLAMLSHELRNPMAAVVNATNLLVNSRDNATRIDEATQVIDGNVQHVSRLLDDLLDLSRFTHDKLILDFQVVDLRDLVDSVVACARPVIDEKNHTLEVHVDASEIYVEGDAGRIRQAQINLLVNAAKYTRANGRIRYSVRREGRDAIISITDDGIGMSDEFMQNVFEPFVQSEQSLDRSEGGMGLGLPLVKLIVEAHAGEIFAYSEGISRGSEFVIHLPLTSHRPAKAVDPAQEIVGGKRVVIIEDNPGIRKMLALSLELDGFSVETASDGAAGLALLQTEKPDIALVDIGLPDMNGYEIARALRQQPTFNDVTLVAVTGYGRSSDRMKSTEAGFDLHLTKPVRVEDIVDVLEGRYVST